MSFRNNSSHWETTATILAALRHVLPTVLLFPALLFAHLEAAAQTIIYRCPESDGVRFGNVRTSAQCIPAYSLSPDEGTSADIELLAKHYARLYGLDSDLLLSMIEVESGRDAEAVSPKGAEGLMQIMPETQRGLRVFDPFNPEESVEAGARLLADLFRQFGRVELALAAYNAGPEAVTRSSGIPPYKETTDYVIRVLSLTLSRKGLNPPAGSSLK